MERKAVTARSKYFLWAAFLFIIFAGHQMGTPAAYSAARLVIEPMSFDCGTVDEGVPATMQVRIENVGDDTALIKNVQTN